MQICVKHCGMPRAEFIKSFQGHESDLKWLGRHTRSRKEYAQKLTANKDAIQRAQRKIALVEQVADLTVTEIKEINRRMSMGEAMARRAKISPSWQKNIQSCVQSWNKSENIKRCSPI